MAEPTLTPHIDTETQWNEEEDTFTPWTPYAVVGWAFLAFAFVVTILWAGGWI